MIYIKQYGLKRSGTNYLRYLIEENFKDVKVLVDILGWKHGYPSQSVTTNWKNWYPEWQPDKNPATPELIEEIKQSVREGRYWHLLMVKDPFAWIISMRKYLKTGFSAGDVEQLSMVWNTMLFQYLNFRAYTPRTIIVRYEDFLLNLEDSMKLLQDTTELEQTGKGTFWTAPELTLERGNDDQDHKGCMTKEEFQKDYYLQRRFMEEFDGEQLDVVRRVLRFDQKDSPARIMGYGE